MTTMLLQTLRMIQALGGPDNITEVRSCVTRVVVDVGSPDLVDRDALLAEGARVVLVTGPRVDVAVGSCEAMALAPEITAAVREMRAAVRAPTPPVLNDH
ncbi:PTS transporter subunit EIIB [Streptomyces sp. H27-H5]|uniref:PTS transporter subunit EIIB n=1 Tax=Streptomyces sp. H27-H5 TaxID=2996460 RepID=UPI002271AB49|nr:PTS transporter subunit EIIB [Streptomyces sp. H27-H5]MCY0963466.1 PTS transporter subunit EIIB [Streptomyces sp. H27-H5]